MGTERFVQNEVLTEFEWHTSTEDDGFTGELLAEMRPTGAPNRIRQDSCTATFRCSLKHRKNFSYYHRGRAQQSSYKNILIKRCNVTQFIHLWKLLYMFRVVSPPIIRSTYNCICTPRLPVVEWTDSLVDLNGLVRFAERRNMVSARVPSHFKRSLLNSNRLSDKPVCWIGQVLVWIWRSLVRVS